LTTALAGELTLDFRCAPTNWQTSICLPDDPFKTLVGCDGGLYYDYGQSGPAAYGFGGGRFGTRLLAELVAEGDATPQQQELHSPRVPVVITRHRQGALELRQVAWAGAPAGESPAGWGPKRADFLRLTVRNTGPAAAAAKLRLRAGSVVALALDATRTRLTPLKDRGETFCRFSRPCNRLPADASLPAIRATHPLEINRHWAKPDRECAPVFRHILVGHRSPLAFEFTAEKNRAYVVALGLIEGWHAEPGKRPLEIRIENQPLRTVDLVKEYGRNKPVVLTFPAGDANGDGLLDIAVHPVKGAPDQNPILSGLWIFPADAAPDAGAILSGKAGSAALAVADADHRPAAPRELTLTWDLGSLGPGNQAEVLIVVPQGAEAKRATSPYDAEAELQRAVAFWEQADLPYGRINVPDAAVQALLDSCVRNIWQAREIKDGLPAFQVGPTCYRGLWVVDGAFILEAAAMLGRAAEARRGIDYLMSFQRPDGGFMLIDKHWKETGIVLWAVTRHARLTGDKPWLEAIWPKLERGFAFIRQMRRQSSADPDAPGAGLIPPGFSDGGLGGPAWEYTNIYWTMAGLRAAVEAAAWLGKRDQAATWRKEYDDFMATFRRAAARDMREDGRGNRCLPIVMNPPDGQPPQKAQWAFLHAVHPGAVFAPDDPLVRGNMAMLRANECEGLVLDTGWLPQGLWNYFGSFYGHAWLWLGDGRKAAETLYAFGNHASRLLCWREEQMPVGQGNRVVGDMPHNWASAEFIRLTLHLLALDRGDELHLLEGLPRAWLRPGAVTRLNGVATPFGPLTMELKATAAGHSATLTVQPLRADRGCRRLVVHLPGGGAKELAPTKANKLEFSTGNM